jgi:hypothetical protein
MKFVIAIFSFLVISIAAFAQDKPTWEELKTFHGVMGQTFHPSEEGNLTPIKTRSAELVEKAKKLAASTPPAAYNRADIKAALKELVAESEKMDKAVKQKKSDAELTQQISAVHDAFHKIAGLCKKGDDE